MTNDKPPVAPVEGHYAVLRNGEVVGPIKLYDQSRYHPYSFTAHLPHMSWTAKGVSSWDDKDYDIIATISPEAMALVTEKSTYGAIVFDLRNRLARLEALIPLADAVLDHADSHCRWFDISTAPKDGTFILVKVRDDAEHWGGRVFASRFLDDDDVALFPGRGAGPDDLTHWAPLPPPPSNPPLPAVFVELGQALER